MKKGVRVPGSLRSEGYTSVGISQVTKSMLKHASGDQPMGHYLKDLLIKELGGKVALEDQEYQASENTIAQVRTELNFLEEVITDIARTVGVKRINVRQPARDKVTSIMAKLNNLKEAPEGQQGELKLT